MELFTKDVDAVLDYGFDWDDDTDPWLGTGETLSTSTWTVESGITKDSDSKTDTITTIWLSGGTEGERYTISNRIVTSDGRTDERSFIVSVTER